jgi:hypothetical protein
MTSAIDLLVESILHVFSRKMSTGALRQLAPDVKAAIERAGLYVDSKEHEALEKLCTLRPESEYTEDMGAVLWWTLPVEEPPYCGTPSDSGFHGYLTHFTPLPVDPRRFKIAKGADASC